MRPHNTVVYAPKTKNADSRHAPPPVGKGLFAWVWVVLRTREPQMVDKLGLDATIFLRFTRMLRNIFLILSIIGIAIMVPVNISQSKAPGKDISTLTLMTPLFVSGNALWSHVICAWIINVIVSYFLWHNYRGVTRLRRQYFESQEYQRSLHSRTLMVSCSTVAFTVL